MMIKKNNRGFTLLEMLVAVALIVIGTIGVFSAVAKYSQHTQQEKENLTAAYLGQEGIEIVKNIRDSNWVAGNAWNTGLSNGNYEAEFDDATLNPWVGQGNFIYIENSTGFYRYIASPATADIKTPFKRMITIASNGVAEIDITVNVYWGSNTMTIKENLFDWK